LLWGPTDDTKTGQVVTTTTGGSYSVIQAGYSMATSGSPLNNGTAEASFSADVGAVAVSTEIFYTLNLVGPANTLVPVRIIASGLAEGFGYSPCCGTQPYSAAASFEIFSAEQGYLVHESAIAYTGVASASLAFDQIVFIQPNTDMFVTLTAGARTIGAYQHTSTITGHAFIDPQFIVEPAFASQYAFAGLPSAIPEPASGLQLVFGGALIAFAIRKRPC
jgi:hypothetical protein